MCWLVVLAVVVVVVGIVVVVVAVVVMVVAVQGAEDRKFVVSNCCDKSKLSFVSMEVEEEEMKEQEEERKGSDEKAHTVQGGGYKECLLVALPSLASWVFRGGRRC